MRFLRLVPVFAVVVMLSAGAAIQTLRGQGAAPARPPLTMSITAFADGTDIPPKYTQAGDQTSPAISWTNTPPGTMSFLLHFHDMEVSRDKTTDDQLHWLVWNIPGTATGLPEEFKGSSIGEWCLPIERERPNLSRSGRSSQWPAAPLHL